MNVSVLFHWSDCALFYPACMQSWGKCKMSLQSVKSVSRTGSQQSHGFWFPSSLSAILSLWPKYFLSSSSTSLFLCPRGCRESSVSAITSGRNAIAWRATNTTIIYSRRTQSVQPCPGMERIVSHDALLVMESRGSCVGEFWCDEITETWATLLSLLFIQTSLIPCESM